MPRKLIIPIVLLVLLLLLLFPSIAKADGIVTFPDANLEAVIREAIQKPTGDIYQSDLKNITRLTAQDRGISNLNGLQYCTSLTELSLRENHVIDISPLSNLTSLTYLNLRDNQIRDISPLSNLTNLTKLWLWGNQISDISPLSNLTSLTELSLRENQIRDISPLSNLTNLTKLWLWENQISDLLPLVQNTGIGNGDYVDVEKNPLSATSQKEYIPQLEQRGVEVPWSPLSPTPAPDNVVTFPDANLEAVIREAIQKPIGDIYQSDLKNITRLTAQDRGISNLNGLQYCTSLTYLDLEYNQINDISPLSNLTSLTILSLGDSQISDISPLSNLTSLTELYLGGNQIGDISPLSSLTSLTFLILWDNQISDLLPLVQNTGIGNGDYVDVSENPLSSKSQNEYIPQLEQRGVEVSWSPLSPAPAPANIPSPRPSIIPQVLAGILITTAIIILALYYRRIRHIRKKKQQSLEVEKAEIIDMIDEALGYDVSEFKDKWLKRS